MTGAGVADTGLARARLAGVVLTGGASRRMGTDKALLGVDGTPMATRVASALRAAGCNPVVLVGGDHESLSSLGEEFVPDEYPSEGPLGAIVTALRWAVLRVDLVLVASCDLAYLSGDELVALVERARSDGDLDVVAARSDHLEPLCAVWRVSALADVERAFASGERAVHRAMAGLSVGEVGIDPAALRNINTPADLGQ